MKGTLDSLCLREVMEDLSRRHPGLVIREFHGDRPNGTWTVEQLAEMDNPHHYSWRYDSNGGIEVVRADVPTIQFRSIFVEPALGAAGMPAESRKKALKDLSAAAETAVHARACWDRKAGAGFIAEDLVDANFGLVEGEPYFFLKFPDGRMLAIKSKDLSRREAEELLLWATTEISESADAKMGAIEEEDEGNVPRPEMWGAESVVRAVKEGFTFLLPFVDKRSIVDPNAYWIGDVQYVAFALTVGPEHTPEIGMRPDGWIWAHTYFLPEMVSNPKSRKAWVTEVPNENGVIEVLIGIDPDTIDWEQLNRGTQIRVPRIF